MQLKQVMESEQSVRYAWALGECERQVVIDVGFKADYTGGESPIDHKRNNINRTETKAGYPTEV